MAPPPTLDLATLREAYAGGKLTPSGLIQALYPKLEAESGAAFLYVEPLPALLARCAELEALPESSRGALWGVPFGVKDNADVAGMPTTAACPAFSYVPEKSTPAVGVLLSEGAQPARRGQAGSRAWAAVPHALSEMRPDWVTRTCQLAVRVRLATSNRTWVPPDLGRMGGDHPPSLMNPMMPHPGPMHLVGQMGGGAQPFSVIGICS